MTAEDDNTAPGGTSDGSPADESLLRLLGESLRSAEPVPDHVVAGARAASTWRTIDEELAALVFDSALETSGVRSEHTARQLTFRRGEAEIEVMIVDDSSRRVVGQLVPPQSVAVHLTSGDRVDEQRSDRLGRFTFDAVPTGPVRLSVMGTDAKPMLSTEWVLF